MPTSPSGRIKVAITLGDPAGIGPEVALKAVDRLKKNHSADFLLLGKAALFADLAKKLKLKLKFEDLDSFQKWNRRSNVISCYFPYYFPKKICLGSYDRSLTEAAVLSIRLAVKLAMSKKVDTIVTPPINKAGLKKAGFNIPGHTEYLAKLSKTKSFEMMLVGGKLRVVLVTRHTALKNVPAKVTIQRVKEAILLTDAELKESFGIKHPRLVICGLNPHAGEQGNIGKEEIAKIKPGVLEAKKKTSSTIIGPLSPDTIFYDAYKGAYDAEICMYHDQGLIPLKMISRGSGVNVTLGLPFIRTSPDHGTGYDIARKFTADPGSMFEALKLACVLSRNRKIYAHTHRRG